MKGSSVTRNTVAKRAGVSPAVVSYVINNSNYVSAQTREKVLKAIKELDYYPNRIARSLKTRKTMQLLLIANDIQNEFYVEVAYFLENIAFDNGFSLFMTNARDNDSFIRGIYEGGYDGVFLYTEKISVKHMNQIAQRGIPVVFASNYKQVNLHKNITVLDVGIYEGMIKILEYLVSKGHKNMHFISRTEFNNGMRDKYSRFRAFNEITQKYNIPGEISFVNPHEEKSISECVDKIVNQPVRPTALASMNDLIAFRIINELEKRGFNVPGDFSVTGFDNIRLAEISTPGITTIDIPKKRMAQDIFDFLTVKKDAGQKEKKYTDPELIIRESA
jgi:DNA-binding LacI/PurR family transcriptional regulator